MITEQTHGNAWQWSIRLTGTDREALADRAEEISAETRDRMMGYMSVSRDGTHEIQMEFMKGDDA